MIRLGLRDAPHRLDLGHGVTVEVRPLTSALMAAARSDPALTEASEATAEVRSLLVTRALARLAILSWEGVGGSDGAPVDPSPERIDALMDLPALADAFRDSYVAAGLALDDEKKGYAPLPSGTLAGAPTTAARAKRSAKAARPR